MRPQPWGWAAAALAAVALPYASPAAAQRTVDFLSGAPVPHLLAAPREPTVHAKLVLELEGPTRFGSITSGDVALGDRLAVVAYRRSDAGPTVLLGVEGGVFGRFNLETRERDLVATDWVFGVPLVLQTRGSWFRLRYHHVSSHLGDEYIERFAVGRADYNRDGVDGTAYVTPTHGLGLYGAVRYVFRVEPPDDGRFTLRAGLEVHPRLGRRSGRPFVAVDVRYDTWERRPAVNVLTGVRLSAVDDRPDVRAVFEIFTGPTPLGQFAALDASWIALGVRVAR